MQVPFTLGQCLGLFHAAFPGVQVEFSTPRAAADSQTTPTPIPDIIPGPRRPGLQSHAVSRHVFLETGPWVGPGESR